MREEERAQPRTAAIRIEREGAIGLVIIDHEARRNAMTRAMWGALPEVFAELTRDDEVRVIIMRGAGTIAFVAGADISEFEAQRTPATASAYERTNQAAYDAVAACPKPVIAMVHGVCIGGGLGLAIAADLRIAADDASFGVPAARLGLGYPPRGIAALVALIGPARAKELFFTPRRFSASEALAAGLVEQVVPKVQLEQEGLRARREHRAERAAHAASF